VNGCARVRNRPLESFDADAEEQRDAENDRVRGHPFWLSMHHKSWTGGAFIPARYVSVEVSFRRQTKCVDTIAIAAIVFLKRKIGSCLRVPREIAY
jgi:hypothetical protein